MTALARPWQLHGSVPYDKRKRERDRPRQATGPQVIVGEAVVETRGRREPRTTPIRSSVTGQPVSGPGTRREHGPSSPYKTVVRVGDAYDVQSVEHPDSLRAAERRRYHKKPR